MTEEEQRALIDTVEPFDLDGAIAIAQKIVDATGDLPQGYWYHLSLLQRDIAAAMEALHNLRPEGAPPYDPNAYV